MQIRFVKMHGLGNDFMVVRWPHALPEPDRARVRKWADRRRGVGFDQLLLVEEQGEGRAAYRVFNYDGGEVEQCGNGARCIASFLAAAAGEGAAGARFTLTSPGGIVEARVLGPDRVSVDLGEPSFEPASLPFAVDRRQERYRVKLAEGSVELGAVSMGNPHAVIEVDSAEHAEVGILGAELAIHAAFPQGVNVGFLEIVGPDRVRLRVYERGVGETPACGTGAAAAVAVGRQWGKLAEEVEVELPGGKLSVRWPGPGAPLWQTGPATKVYEGAIEL